MTRTSRRTQSLFHTLSILSSLLTLSHAQCNTDQNPYCSGNNQFEQLCCPYPNVCYWSDREGTPGCCAAGQICLDSGGGYVTPPAQPTTVYSTRSPTPTTQPLSTITSYVSQPEQTNVGGVVVVITTLGPVEEAWSTVTSDVAGAYSTVTSEVAGAFSTVTSEVVGAFETVTSTAGAVVTAVATDLVQNLNAAPAAPKIENLSFFAPLLALVLLLVV